MRVADRLGVAADEVKLGVLDGWDVLGLIAPDNPFTLTREQQDEGAKNPRWVPDVAQDTTASISAHVHTAVAAEAANVILRFGLWPAALAIWSAGRGGQAAGVLRFEDVRFVDGRLTAAGREPLALSARSPPRRTRWASSLPRWCMATIAGPGRRRRSIFPAAATTARSMRWR